MTAEKALTPVEEAKKQADKANEAKKESGEQGGPKGQEPTRYNDWENNGRCWDF